MASSSTFDVAAQISGIAAAALSQGQLLVRTTANQWAVSGLTNAPEAVALADIASGAYGPIKLLSSADTFLGKCDGDGVSDGDVVYGAADGEVSATQGVGAFAVGIAWETKSADGDLVEVHYKPGYTAGT